MMINKKKLFNIWFFLFLGLLIRIILAFIDSNGDLNNHIMWGKNIVENGFVDFYIRDFPKLYGTAMPNYPPLAMYFFSLMYFLYNLVWPIIWNIKIHLGIIPASFIWFWEQQKIFLPVFMKIPAIMADLGIAYYIYLFIKKLKIKNPQYAPIFGALLILFNPAFIYNSAYWGQIDGLPLCFLIASFYYLLFQKKTYFSIFLFTLALLAKQTVAVFIPLYGLIFIRKKAVKDILISIFIFFLTFIVIFFPFSIKANIFVYPFQTYIEKVLLNFGSEYLTAHAFNFWGLMTGLGHIRDLSFLILGIPARYIATLIVAGFITFILFKLYIKKFSTNQLITAGYLIPLTMFLFSTRMHERHLLIVLPFLLIGSALSKKTLFIFLFLSFFHFLNMYNGWWSPHPPEIFIQLFGSALTINMLILITIIIYFYMFYKYVKS